MQFSLWYLCWSVCMCVRMRSKWDWYMRIYVQTNKFELPKSNGAECCPSSFAYIKQVCSIPVENISHFCD